MSGITTADLIMLGLVVLSTLVGFWRGFVKEVFALVVWVFALAAAFYYSDSLAVLLEPHIDVPSARTGLAFLGVFLIVLVVGGLLTFLVGKLVEKTGLSGTDRLLGGIFGAARGLILLIALILTTGFTPVPLDDWWQESRVIQGLLPLAQWAGEFLPEEALKYLDLYPQSETGETVQPGVEPARAEAGSEAGT